MSVYTDLAAEVYGPRRGRLPAGVRVETRYAGEVTVTRVTIARDGLARRRGRYVTLELPGFTAPEDRGGLAMRALAHELRNLLPAQGDLLVVGLGNEAVTADSLGPAVCRQILVTRQLPQDAAARREFGLRGAASFCPGIEARTGLTAAESVRSIAAAMRPAAVLCVDSLCTGEPARLGRTVQLTDTGICPGGDERRRIDAALLGVPTLGLGVPTLMDASELCPGCVRLAVTPREIDAVVARAAALLAMAINCALHTGLAPEELRRIVS